MLFKANAKGHINFSQYVLQNMILWCEQKRFEKFACASMVCIGPKFNGARSDLGVVTNSCKGDGDVKAIIDANIRKAICL